MSLQGTQMQQQEAHFGIWIRSSFRILKMKQILVEDCWFSDWYVIYILNLLTRLLSCQHELNEISWFVICHLCFLTELFWQISIWLLISLILEKNYNTLLGRRVWKRSWNKKLLIDLFLQKKFASEGGMYYFGSLEK